MTHSDAPKSYSFCTCVSIDAGAFFGKKQIIPLLFQSAKTINCPKPQAMPDFVRKGIAIAKANQKYKGRQSVKLPPDFPEQYQLYLSRKLKKSDWAKQLDVSRPTLDKMIARFVKKV